MGSSCIWVAEYVSWKDTPGVADATDGDVASCQGWGRAGRYLGHVPGKRAPVDAAKLGKALEGEASGLVGCVAEQLAVGDEFDFNRAHVERGSILLTKEIEQSLAAARESRCTAGG